MEQIEVIRLRSVVDESLELLEGAGDGYIEGRYGLAWFPGGGSAT